MALAALVACLLSGLAQAAPHAYSVNADSDNDETHDSLYLIDLANGAETRIGPLLSFGQLRTDVEGLAIAPDGTLYGIDDDNNSLFPINSSNGIVVGSQEVFISGIPGGGGNDFGMTFGCDGDLYVSSVKTQTLYRVTLDGQATPVGAPGALGANISAIAAYGDPVELYGLGNGHNGMRTVFSIDASSGTAAPIGTLGDAALDYTEAGLAFDEAGMLWAITDRRAVSGGPFPNQILRIDAAGGENPNRATAIATTSDNGFESLAIGPPSGCFDGGEGENAMFTVTKRFMDQNNIRNVRFTLSCNTGLPLEQSITVQRPGGPYQDAEITIVVTDFASGTLDCQLREQVPNGYEASYSCDGESSCTAGTPSPVDPYFTGPCEFTDAEQGDENLCFIRNYVRPVDVEVTKLWIDENEQFQGPTNAQMAWACVNARSSGDDLSLGTEEGFLSFQLAEQTEPFSVYPNFDPAQPTVCTVMEEFPGFDSDIESDDSDCDGLEVSLGSDAACTVTNTRLYPGIPTLSDYGKLLLVLLMLSVGLIGVRRTL